MPLHERVLAALFQAVTPRTAGFNTVDLTCMTDVSKGLITGLMLIGGFRRWVKVAKSGGLCYTCVMGTWKSKNRHKYLLQYHIIFVCKYRKKLLMSKQISDDIIGKKHTFMDGWIV